METSDNISYIYDVNGNMIADKNKGIETIVYNHLNLPTRIFIQTDDQKGEINYIYDATGVKLAKKVTDYIHETSLTTIYANGFIYEQKENQVPELKFFSHAEGYVEPTVTSSGVEMSYVYQYKDHTSTMLSAGLGNIRLSYKDNNGNLEIVEENNYYPFGLKHKGYNSVINGAHYPYGFNGKEENDELGLEWLDFGARNYDAALGRWMNIDPLAENGRGLSPYNFAFNNPVRFIDPDGMWPGYYDQYDLEWGGYMQDDWDQRHYEGQNFGNTGFDRPFDPSSKYEMQLAAIQADFYEHYYDDEEDYSDYEFLDSVYLVEGNDLSEAQVKAIMDQIYSNEFYDYLEGGLSPYDFSGETRFAMAMSPDWLGLPSLPDAMSIELNGSVGAGVASNTSPIGALIKLNGNISGNSVNGYFQGSAGGGSIFASADIVVTQYYVMGPNANKVVMKDFNGVFYSGNIAIDAGISLGGGISWSSPFDGAHIIGVSTSFGVGVSPTIISAGAYGGIMEFYSKN